MIDALELEQALERTLAVDAVGKVGEHLPVSAGLLVADCPAKDLALHEPKRLGQLSLLKSAGGTTVEQPHDENGRYIDQMPQPGEWHTERVGRSNAEAERCVISCESKELFQEHVQFLWVRAQ